MSTPTQLSCRKARYIKISEGDVFANTGFFRDGSLRPFLLIRSCISLAASVHLPEYNKQQGMFDVVAMYSLIEHTNNPVTYLQQAYDLLRQDGILVLRLPDTPDEGPPASLIAHRYHFNERTISELLDRCGFEVLWTGSRALWKPRKYPGELWSMNIISRKK
ncbi:MAG: methyltransferase domain-containing protein [Candidatus Hodarchaeota archaeon]